MKEGIQRRLHKLTIVLSKFNGLEDYLQGKITTQELNEKVFLDGFMAVRYQEQITTNHGDIYVIQGIVDDIFVNKESERIQNEDYLLGWELFLNGPYKKARIKIQ